MGVSSGVVRSLGSAQFARSPADLEDFEQELVDQYALSMVGSGIGDCPVATDRATLFKFIEFLGQPIWTAQTSRQRIAIWAGLRQERRLAPPDGGERRHRPLARFFEFVISRYQGDISALTGCGRSTDRRVQQAAQLRDGGVRVPPSDEEVDELFANWRAALADVRKYLPAVRDYFAASLWRRLGLRINETVMLDIRDWRPDLGGLGKLHIRHGKGARGRGPKARLVPAINGADELIDWWLGDVRHQFGEDWSDPDAPMLPSERHDPVLPRCRRVGAEALRQGLVRQTAGALPAWSGRLTPHVLRHYCASSLYASGMDLKALQELLGHQWLSTTTGYIHVRSDYVEQAWAESNRRVGSRFGEGS